MSYSTNNREVETKRDISLLERIGHGDENALADLYDNHSRLVYSLVLDIVGNIADAEEVTQEIFLKVWQNAKSFEATKGKPLAWIVTISRRLAIDRTRSKGYKFQKRSTELDQIALNKIDQENSNTLSHSMLDRLHKSEVRNNLNQLSEKQLEVIHLSYYETMSHSMISERLNIPLGTVKSRLREAMSQLRKLMEVQGITK